MNSYFTLRSCLEVGKTQELPSKFWQTLGDALTKSSSKLPGAQICTILIVRF
jgi:hypothetical protein